MYQIVFNVIIGIFWRRYNKVKEMCSVLQTTWNKLKSESVNKVVDHVTGVFKYTCLKQVYSMDMINLYV